MAVWKESHCQGGRWIPPPKKGPFPSWNSFNDLERCPWDVPGMSQDLPPLPEMHVRRIFLKISSEEVQIIGEKNCQLFDLIQ